MLTDEEIEEGNRAWMDLKADKVRKAKIIEVDPDSIDGEAHGFLLCFRDDLLKHAYQHWLEFQSNKSAWRKLRCESDLMRNKALRKLEAFLKSCAT